MRPTLLACLWACSPTVPLKTAGLDTSVDEEPETTGGEWDSAPDIHTSDDTGAPSGWGCTTGPSTPFDELPTPSAHSEGHQYHVVEVDTAAFETFYVVVLTPPAAYRSLYDAGAPVIVTSMQSIGIGQAWATEPRSFIPLELGVVEVQPVHPGWIASGSATPGVHDGAGPQTAASLHEAIRFAIGETQTADGHTLRDLVNREICTGSIAILGASSGGITAATALDQYGEGIKDRLLGAAFYETPSLPTFVVGDTGFKDLDRWPTEDTDGNGVVWDEGRNPNFEGCDLSTLQCGMDLSTLAWSATVTPADVAPTDFEPGASGILYLDRNANGRLDLAPDGHVDADGDGLIGTDEDYFFLPFQDLRTSGTERQRYSPGVATAAAPIFAEAGWPAHIAPADEAGVFWSERDATAAAIRAAPTLGADFRFSVAFSAEDHAIPVAERPHMGILYASLLEVGATVRTNLDRAAASCLVGDEVLGDWSGGSEPGATLDTDALVATAMPLDFPPRTGRALATLGLFWDSWGPFDVCPGELSSR